ncbi:MAG: hypothetical protein CSA23_00990 [Deltaproteobacteria bacterium]|nr:MAG: hypothetical protein CSA23_00990 [Deltaproteobacteria bacterium]
MKEKFSAKLDVKTFTLDSEEAKPYALQFKSSTNVRFNDEWVPLDVATDKSKMEDFLSQRL